MDEDERKWGEKRCHFPFSMNVSFYLIKRRNKNESQSTPIEFYRCFLDVRLDCYFAYSEDELRLSFVN